MEKNMKYYNIEQDMRYLQLLSQSFPTIAEAIMLGSSALGLLLVLVMVLLREMTLLTPSVITLYNTVAALVMMAVQNVRKY